PSNRKSESFQDLRTVLSAIEVKIPAKLADDGKEVTTDLLKLFYGNRDTLINGVTNKVGASDAESFFFFNVCPKLQVHGLAVNERVAGVRYRRYAITALGSAFLADMEKRLLLATERTKEVSAHREAATATSAFDESATGKSRKPGKASAKSRSV